VFRIGSGAFFAWRRTFTLDNLRGTATILTGHHSVYLFASAQTRVNVDSAKDLL
jgi:hypothetical protein